MSFRAGRWQKFSAFVFVLAGMAMAAGASSAQEKVRFGTNWLAQAEHGGFYQALADGTYAKFGLDVTIVPGGPQAANRQLMLAGKIDLYMAGNMMAAISSVEQDIPIVQVAAIFQKDPQVLIAHPDTGINTLADLAKVPTIFMGKDLFVTTFQWLKSINPEFNDAQFKPYQFNPAPFLADKASAQQGYVTSEPFAIKNEAGFEPKLFLLADEGFKSYSTLIETTRDYLIENRDVVQRFVDASIIGWYTYLYGDSSPANAFIKKDNPGLSDEQIAFSIDAMKAFGIVDSGDAKTFGIGCMTEERITGFYEQMVGAGVVPGGLDLSAAFDSSLVCKNVGADLF